MGKRLAVSLLACALAGSAFSQQASVDTEPDARTRSRMSEHGPYRSRMRVVRDSTDLAAPADAAELLDAQGDAYGRALLLRRLAHDDAAEQDLPGAIARLEEALALDALAAPAQQQMALNLARLYAAAGRHADAVEMFEPWLREHPDADPEIFFNFGYALIQTGRAERGAGQLRQAIAGRDPPPEDWLRVLLYSEHKEGDYRSAAGTARQLLAAAPGNSDYWLQLAAVLRAAGEPGQAAAVLEQAAVEGLLTQPHQLFQLVHAYLAAELPYDAARLLASLLDDGRLEATVQNWSLLANAWLAAREAARAIAPLQNAARNSDDRRLWLEVARLEMEQQRWDDAIKSLRLARRRNTLDTLAGEALLLLGEAQYRSGRPRAARKTFRLAADYGVVYRSAELWLDYLDGLPAQR